MSYNDKFGDKNKQDQTDKNKQDPLKQRQDKGQGGQGQQQRQGGQGQQQQRPGQGQKDLGNKDKQSW